MPVVNGVPLPGPEPTGTVFKVSARYQGHAYSSSAKWHGTVRALTRPVLDGAARVGATVAATPATWSGGWATDSNQIAIEACKTRNATGCVMLTGVWLQCSTLGCGIQGSGTWDNRKTRVGDPLSGWYLFALDARISPGISGLVGISFAAALPLWRSSATLVRSAPYGPVLGPRPPRVYILPQARVEGRRVTFASVRCAMRCHVWLTVSRWVHHEQSLWSANSVITGTATVGVSSSIPPGRVVVRINVDDGPYIHGYSRIS